MKLKTLLSVVCFLSGLVYANAQSNSYCFIQNDSCFTRTCVATSSCDCSSKHPVFNIPVNKTPKKLARLGSFPQFGTLKNFSTEQEVFDYLKGVYRTNRNRNAAELDALWRAMGYSGFNDASFTVNQMRQTILPCGIIGMLGDGNHHYAYSEICPGTNGTLTAYVMTAKTGCDVTIMETCGNAFFAGCSADYDCKTTSCGPVPANVRGEDERHVRYTYIRNDSCFVRKCERKNLSCADKHPVFNVPADATAKKLARLGTYPQFGTLKNFSTTQEVYDYLKGVYRINRNGNAAELDKLWRAMGYSGFSDARFTVDRMQQVTLPCGIKGMLGNGAHQYIYSEICPGSDATLTAYTFSAISGCDVTIMETCGNAFYSGGTELINCVTEPCGCTVR